MANKITKTELKLIDARERYERLNSEISTGKIILAGRGFGKTFAALTYVSQLGELSSQIARLEWRVRKIHANRLNVLQRREEAKITRKLEREGQKLATAVQEWLR